MAQAYIRQSTFADGDTITAALFNDEYNQLVNAFAYSSSSASSTGHRHDGTAGQGGNIFKIGDLDFLNKVEIDSSNNRVGFYVEVSSAAVEQVRIQDGAIVPVTDSDIDLGTTSLRFKDTFTDSITTTGNVDVGGNLTVTGTTTFNGGTITMGDAADDNVVFGADVNSNIIPNTDNTYDLGSSSQEWKDLYVDGVAYLDGINFNGTAITSTAAELNILDGVTATATELNLLDGVTATTTELNLIDGGSSIGTDAIADGDGIIHNDGGTMKVTSAATFKTYFQTGISSAADDITTGDAAVTIATSSGNITIDAQAGDTDIIFKGTDSSADITALTLDMSDAGTAVFNHDIKIADDGQIGSASAADAMIISSGGIVTFKDDILIKDGGTIGAASDADSITIASNGVVTFSQAPVFPDGSIAVADLDIDGATDINADLVDADLFIVDDGAGGTNRKVAASRIKTYIGGGTQWQSVKTSNYTASAGQGVFANTTSGSFTITLPAGTLGDEISIVDYAGTFDSNALTVAADGSEKIFGSTDDLTVSTERAAFTLVFTDSTQGWLFKND